MDSVSKDIFEGKVRVRACGIIIKDDKVLLLKHKGVGAQGHLWSPPGGGVEFGQSIEDTLRREILEETNLNVVKSTFLFVNEYIDDKYHAVELFFKSEVNDGTAELGFDPELSNSAQILQEVKWFNINEIKALKRGTIHNAFEGIETLGEILDKRGFFIFENISIK